MPPRADVLRAPDERLDGLEGYSRVIASNPGLPAGEGASRELQQWIDFRQSVEALPISAIVDASTRTDRPA